MLVAPALLHLLQFVVVAPPVHELVVCTLLQHSAVMDDDDDVSVLYGGQSVCDRNARASQPGMVECLLNDLRQE